MANLAYVTSIGTLKKMLERIQEASLPEHFNSDFVETKLRMKGGTPRAIIPFIKKMGFVSNDGLPTDLYREFRNKTRSGYAIAKSMRMIFKEVFDMNEYANELSEKEIIGLIVQITGGDAKSAVTKYTAGTFKALNEIADFDTPEQEKVVEIVNEPKRIGASQEQMMQLLQMQQNRQQTNGEFKLSYTINLNLPLTTDIEVFNAIFKSLKEHLVDQL